MKPSSILFGLLILIFSACDEDSSVEPVVETSEIHVHLQYGFEYMHTIIDIDEKNYFTAILSGIVPLAGPMASFSTSLSKGIHILTVKYSSTEASIPNFSEKSFEFEIGSSDEYYVGIKFIDDSISVTVQESVFDYI